MQVVHVLLLEDEPEDANYIRETLEPPIGVQFRIHHVRLLSDALDFVGQNEIDVALVDLNLPDSTGNRTVAELRRGGFQAPIVVLTSLQLDSLPSLIDTNSASELIHKWELDGHAVSRSLMYVVERFRREEQLKRITRDHVDATFVVGTDRKILFANDAALAMLDVPAADAISLPFPYPLDTSRTMTVETEEGGATHTFEVRSSSIEWDRSEAFLASVRDITDRAQAEELRQRLAHTSRLASMGQLAAGVAHELNNPIAFIHANMEMTRDSSHSALSSLQKLRELVESDSSELAGRVQQVLSEAALEDTLSQISEMAADNLDGTQRMTSIVKDLRVFSRIDRDECVQVDLAQLVESACNMVRNEIRHRAALVKEFDQVPQIVADRAKLTQVVTNLLVNAVQAIEPGRADSNEIRIGLSEEAGEIVISVSDTGHGIPPQLKERIFEPFFTTKPRDVGTGLGLPLSVEVVRKHGGTIRVHTQERGSRFDIRLPVHTKLNERPAQSTRQMRPSSSNPIWSRQVLLVDDDEALLRAVKRRLEDAYGYRVTTTTSASEALALATNQPRYDVVVCDLMMPEMDGARFYDSVCARSAEQPPSFVFLSGGVFSDTVSAFVERMSMPFVSKPIDFEALVGAIESVATPESPSETHQKSAG